MPTPITTPEHFRYDHPEWPYLIHVSCIPLGLPRGDPLRQRFDDRTISVPNVNGSVWFTVEDAATNVVAHATFACGPADVQCDTITVDPGHQRRMIATAIYHLAASQLRSCRPRTERQRRSLSGGPEPKSPDRGSRPASNV